MLLSLRLMLCTGFLCFAVSDNKESTSSPSWQSLALGSIYGCSKTFASDHCWKYCRGTSGQWCYTVKYTPNSCTTDLDCRWMSHCQGWCAWNSPSLCVKYCNFKPEEEKPQCGENRSWWKCQISYPGGVPSNIASEGKWISPDIRNDRVMDTTTNSITFNGNIATVTKKSDSALKALWYPMGVIKSTTTTFYWTFTISQTGTSSGSVNIGLSDLKKIISGRGLFYVGPNLSDGSGLLIQNFGPTLVNGDKLSILVKLLESRMKVYIILNGKSLGLAFDVPENTLNGIYPVVKFRDEGVAVEIREGSSSDAPTELEPARPISMMATWTLHSLGELGVVSMPTVTMKVTETYDRVHDKAYKLRIQAVNKFLVKIIEKSKSNWAGEILDQTVKQGTASEMELEAAISKHISGIRNVVLDAVKRELQFESADSKSVWKLANLEKKTVDFNPFKKTAKN